MKAKKAMQETKGKRHDEGIKRMKKEQGEGEHNHRLAQSDVFEFKNRSVTKKSVHLGRNRLPASETPASGSTADASLVRKGSSDVLDRTCVLCSVDLVL